MPLLPSVKLTVNFIKDKKQVIAYAPALDISTVKNSEEQAKRRFGELVQMFLKDISERHVIDQVLTELGWTKATVQNQSQPQWIPPVVTSIDLQVPIAA